MKPWKKLLLYFVSLTGILLSSLIIVLACGGELDPYDYYTSFFHADTQGKKDYGSFYYTDFQFTYDEAEPESEAAINSGEWATYLGGSVKAKDVETAMYKLDNAGKKKLIHLLDQDLALADSLAGNSFLIALKQPEHAAALQYYRFALEVEPLANKTYDLWNPAPLDTAGLSVAVQKALTAAGSISDDFIKLRYYYQAQRLFHFGKDYKQAQEIYEQHIANAPSKSHVKGWALSCKAGEDRRLGDTVRAAYLFSKVFADYPERRLQAYRNYHYISAPFDDVLKMAGTPAEKANLYAIKGFANPEIETDDLEQSYAQAPSSPIVGVLLVREINKLEQYYLTKALDNNTDEAYSAKPGRAKTDQAVIATPKWPLITGFVILLAGITIMIWMIRKRPGQTSGKIAGGVLMIVGIIGMSWFAIRHFGNRPLHETALQQGSFFAAMPDSIKAKYNTHIEKLKSFCTQLTNDKKYQEPQLGLLVNAYLCFMQNKADDGLSSLSKLDGQPLSPALADQKQIVNLLLSAQRLKQLTTVDEAALLPSLQWLHNKVVTGGKHTTDIYPETPANHNQFAITERNFYTYVLAPAYLRQGDTVKASLTLLKSQNNNSSSYRDDTFKQMPDFWYNFLHTGHLQQIINWKANTPTDPYLTFLSDGLKQIGYDKLYELLGTIQLREHHYQDALVSFRKVKSKLTSPRAEEAGVSDGDPFSTAINDYPHEITTGLNKLQFAQKMAELEAKLKVTPNDASVYFDMATGIYNTSTYGNSYNMITYAWSSYDFGRKSIYYYDADYIKTSIAKQYYLKARELSADPEFKAKCTFMAAKCDQKKHEAPSYRDYDNYDKSQKAYIKMLKTNSYFPEMQQYKNTAFYKQAVNECSYLRDFIDGK